MDIEVVLYDEVCAWLEEVKSKSGKSVRPRLLLGNGFSIAYDFNRFSYRALLATAHEQGLVNIIAQKVFDHLETQDFEIVIKTLQDAALGLEVLDEQKYAAEIYRLREEAAKLKEALAQVLAGLHPDRPGTIGIDVYIRVRKFLDRFDRIYTANYDLLLYWTLMQDIPATGIRQRTADDGFRDPGYPADYVLWDHLKPLTQSVFYIHGALHLFRGEDGLKKLTWIRTDEPLVDQIRRELSQDNFPLYVAEGTSADKLGRIHTSDYLSRALRSLAEIGGGLVVYGLSFGNNDAHIADAIVRSNVIRLAVSLYGDPGSAENQRIVTAAQKLVEARENVNSTKMLELKFFDAASVSLWH